MCCMKNYVGSVVSDADGIIIIYSICIALIMLYSKALF